MATPVVPGNTAGSIRTIVRYPASLPAPARPVEPSSPLAESASPPAHDPAARSHLTTPAAHNGPPQRTASDPVGMSSVPALRAVEGTSFMRQDVLDGGSEVPVNKQVGGTKGSKDDCTRAGAGKLQGSAIGLGVVAGGMMQPLHNLGPLHAVATTGVLESSATMLAGARPQAAMQTEIVPAPPAAAEADAAPTAASRPNSGPPLLHLVPLPPESNKDDNQHHHGALVRDNAATIQQPIIQLSHMANDRAGAGPGPASPGGGIQHTALLTNGAKPPTSPAQAGRERQTNTHKLASSSSRNSTEAAAAHEDVVLPKPQNFAGSIPVSPLFPNRLSLLPQWSPSAGSQHALSEASMQVKTQASIQGTKLCDSCAGREGHVQAGSPTGEDCVSQSTSSSENPSTAQSNMPQPLVAPHIAGSTCATLPPVSRRAWAPMLMRSLSDKRPPRPPAAMPSASACSAGEDAGTAVVGCRRHIRNLPDSLGPSPPVSGGPSPRGSPGAEGMPRLLSCVPGPCSVGHLPAKPTER